MHLPHLHLLSRTHSTPIQPNCSSIRIICCAYWSYPYQTTHHPDPPAPRMTRNLVNDGQLNIGNTCYINACLRSLSLIVPMAQQLNVAIRDRRGPLWALLVAIHNGTTPTHMIYLQQRWMASISGTFATNTVQCPLEATSLLLEYLQTTHQVPMASSRLDGSDSCNRYLSTDVLMVPANYTIPQLMMEYACPGSPIGTTINVTGGPETVPIVIAVGIERLSNSGYNHRVVTAPARITGPYQNVDTTYQLDAITMVHRPGNSYDPRPLPVNLLTCRNMHYTALDLSKDPLSVNDAVTTPVSAEVVSRALASDRPVVLYYRLVKYKGPRTIPLVLPATPVIQPRPIELRRPTTSIKTPRPTRWEKVVADTLVATGYDLTFYNHRGKRFHSVVTRVLPLGHKNSPSRADRRRQIQCRPHNLPKYINNLYVNGIYCDLKSITVQVSANGVDDHDALFAALGLI